MQTLFPGLYWPDAQVANVVHDDTPFVVTKASVVGLQLHPLLLTEYVDTHELQ